MPSPSLPLDPSPETLAFRAVVQVLRADPTLKRVVNAAGWQVWDNSPGELVEPTAAQLPYVMLTPAFGGMGWSEATQHKSKLIVAIRLAVLGTHADDLLNLWHAVRRALYPLDVAQRAKVQLQLSPLVTQGELTREPFQALALAGAKALVGDGALTLTLYVNT